jgi:hypothetical protein
MGKVRVWYDKEGDFLEVTPFCVLGLSLQRALFLFYFIMTDSLVPVGTYVPPENTYRACQSLITVSLS